MYYSLTNIICDTGSYRYVADFVLIPSTTTSFFKSLTTRLKIVRKKIFVVRGLQHIDIQWQILGLTTTFFILNRETEKPTKTCAELVSVLCLLNLIMPPYHYIPLLCKVNL